MAKRLDALIRSRAAITRPSDDPTIGCVLLDECFFLPAVEQRTPEQFGLTFPQQVVKFKTFDRGALALGAHSSDGLSAGREKRVQEVAEAEEAAGAFDPTSERDARERAHRSIVQRRGQPAFRRALLSAYGDRCAVSGCEAVEVLEAAHIMPYRGEHTNALPNGILLRSDLHTRFDLGLMTVAASDYAVILDASLHAGQYAMFHGARVRLPADERSWPSKEALQRHKDMCGL